MAAMRLTLIVHAATPAVRAAAFPLDEPLDAQGLAAAQVAAQVAAEAAPRAAGWPRRVDAAWTAPAARARQTAAALGLAAAAEPALRELDHGRWAGRTLAAVAAEDPAGMAAWLADPAVAPHGGETIEALLRRVTAWLDGLGAAERVVAVTHAAVARAAVLAVLQAPPAAFWRIDVAPLGRVRLRGGPGRWSLVGVG